MSKTNFWNSFARGMAQGFETGRRWKRESDEAKDKQKERDLKDKIVGMIMGNEREGEAAPVEVVQAQDAAPIVVEQVTPQMDAGAAPALVPVAIAAPQMDTGAALERGVRQAQQQEAARAMPVQSGQVESYTIPPGAQEAEQVTQAPPTKQQEQGVAALQSVMRGAPVQAAAPTQGNNQSFMNALGALAVLKGDINTAAALRGKAQQEQWDAEDAAVAARMMNDPQGEEMQSLMGSILTSALPGVRARRDDKTGETSVYVTDEDGTHEVPLKGQTLLNAIRAKQMLDRGQYGLAVQHLSAIDKTLAERAAQTIQTNLQNLKLAQMQQSMGIADAKLAMAQQMNDLRARQINQSMAHSAGRYGMAQQEFAARMADREQQRQLAQQHPELLAALAESEGYSPQHVAAIKAGAIKYTPQRAPLSGGGGSALAGAAGGVSSKEAWDPKAVREFYSKRERDALGQEIKTPDIEAEQALMRYAAKRGINDWKQAYRMMEMEGIQKADARQRVASDPKMQAALQEIRKLPKEQQLPAMRALFAE